MKKVVKTLCIFIFAVLIIGLSKNVQANSINQISMDIYVDNNGNAKITETWNCSANQGTEVYHPYYNLGNSKITNLKVRENGIYYQTLSTWRTSGSLSDKANKCGINKISNGVELCWGISSYGSHTYTVEYTITDFVSELTDSQMIYWTLIPHDFSNSIGSVHIKIHTDFRIADTVDVWGYGNYGGTAYVYNGYIEMQSDGRLDKDEYMTILVKFPKGTFNASNQLDYNFNHYYEMAEEGAEHHVYIGNEARILITIISTVGMMIIGTVLLSILIAPEFSSMNTNIKFGSEGKKIPKDVAYYRDIPCNRDIFRAYYIGHQYGLLKNKTDVLGAIILKWIKDSIVKIEQKETGTICKKENVVIVLNDVNPEVFRNTQEKAIFDMLYSASEDGILESKEFEKWCNRYYRMILKWFDEILEEEKLKLVNEGLIIEEEKKGASKEFKYKEYTLTHELKEEAMQIAGLKRYLKEYTLIKDREAIEVAIFEEYLIYAQLMGIAKKVAKEFKDLYPHIIEESSFSSYDNIIFINYCTNNGVSHANSAKARAESYAAAHNYSSGGGGFSSGGGGGGSFGGGGGGGGFR